MLLVMLPEVENKAFNAIYDLKDLFARVFGKAVSSEDTSRIKTSVVAPVKFMSLDTVLALIDNNPVFYGKKTKVKQFYTLFRADTKGTSFPFSIYPQRYKELSDFKAEIPDKHSGLCLSITNGEKYTIGDLLLEIEDVVKTTDDSLMIFGCYREEKCYGEHSLYLDNVRKVLNVFISDKSPGDETAAGVGFDIAIVEGKQ